MRSSRRKVIKQFGTRFSASVLAGDAPLFWAQQTSDLPIEEYLGDPLLQPVCVIDFEPLAKAKLDPLAYAYLMDGLEDEVSRRDNRSGFDKIIIWIWPKELVDVHKVDLSVKMFGQKWEHPLFLCPAGGKNCIHPDGENTVARTAATAKTLQITNGEIQELVESGKGPAWWQVTTGGDFCTPQTIRTSVKRLEDQGCGAICFTTDITYVSHRERNIRNKFDCSFGGTRIPRDAQGRVPQPRNPERPSGRSRVAD